MDKQTILTGAQPTNKLHIGNYLIIKKMIEQQNKGHDILIFVADLHALTVSSQSLSYLSLTLAAYYQACGLNNEKTIIFKQSDMAGYHTTLMWVLSCFCPMGRLDRMAQMKDKSKQHGAFLGIYSYPVLMAADILLYNPSLVPVGEDQKQHMELTLFLSDKMNQLIGNKYFHELSIETRQDKISALSDGKKKMSKSGKAQDCIFLDDKPEDINKKIMKAKTDDLVFPYSVEEAYKRPEINNLINIYKEFSDCSYLETVEAFRGKNHSEFKKQLAHLLIEKLTPIREKMEKFHSSLEEQNRIKDLLISNSKKIEPIAKKNLDIITKLFF